ncbi:thiamine phosphate synthase [Emcibacter nanhaiensis]|uniref:thiamine phosphate synthase n=1 Tax=Emcibacter nanhaiensis TaxID=1505037 RepID=UPI001C616349|nr:thiamine phosphate synthase [Emcibacter nanhaiensis]
MQIPDRLPATSVVILRDYDHPEREVLAARLAEMCQRRRLYFFVGGDAALAHRVGAHGVHLPERLIDRLPRLRQTYQTFLFTASCHSARALLRAERLGADAVLLSPVFPTHSHAETFSRPERTLGACRFRTLCRRSNIPVYALGGLNVDTAPRLRQSTLAGLASIRGYEG